MATVNVALLGTCDTKLQELLFLRDRIQENESVKVILIDVGRRNVEDDAISVFTGAAWWKSTAATRTHQSCHGASWSGSCPQLRHRRPSKELYDQGRIHGIAAAGGSGGTSLAAAPMRDALPIGFPKLIVSTVGSGDTGPIVGETDIGLVYSVVDVAGLNQLLREILSNAGAQIAAAAVSYARRREQGAVHAGETSKKRVGITMFGVTTPGVDAIRSHLESTYPIETYVFHATGHWWQGNGEARARGASRCRPGSDNYGDL